jgi:flagellar biosynthesis protein FlhB
VADRDFQERTEKATPRRREKARDEGKVAKSQELNAAAIITLGFLTLYMVGPSLTNQVWGYMSYTFSNAPAIAASDPTFVSIFHGSMFKFFSMLLPVFAILTAVAFGVNVAQVGFKISSKAMEPKFEKLNVITGAKRLFSMRSLVQLFRDTLKLVIIATVAYFSLKSEFPSFFLLADMNTTQIAGTMGTLAVTLALKIGGAYLAIAFLDFLYQRYEFEKSIRMSKQEIKEEHKDTEGNPQLKGRLRQVQRQMSQGRMMKAVPKADVVIKNPTHLAVALKYDPTEGTAPIVLAKGERLVAQRIIQIAEAHDIPVIEDKPLARALFKMCEVGQMVPANLYRAVAEVLAYVYRLKGKVIK